MTMTIEVKELKVEDIKKQAEDTLKCPVQKALLYVSGFLDGPMCGRCFPCAMGSYEAKIRLQKISMGEGSEDDIAALKKIAGQMAEASMCKKGKDTAKFISEWIASGVYNEHIAGRCPEKECLALVEFRVITDKCIMCGDCLDACKYGAIMGEKKISYKSGYMPYEIRQKRCIKCGECVPVCPTDAIVVVDVKDKTVQSV
jgi:ferredoxin